MADEDKQRPDKGIPDEIARRIGRNVSEPPKNAPGSPSIQGSQMQIKPEDELESSHLHAEMSKEAAAAASPSPAVIKHVWTSEDTYASLAFKYYGSIKEPYWRLIYDHNKQIIGNHPNDIRVGLEIEIPPLPDELKNK